MNIQWEPNRYAEGFNFVYGYGQDVAAMVDAPAGSFVVDLGCGTGVLTDALHKAGYRVLGIDASEEMLGRAKSAYLHIPFLCADATAFTLEEKADVIFSNAVFHWIDKEKQDKLLSCIGENLKPGGMLVCEFGGFGCGERAHAALEKAFTARGLTYPRTFYFPTVGEYAPLLEQHGLRVEFAALFDRPTPQKGEDGMENWIRMFIKAPFAGMEEGLKNAIIQEAVEAVRPVLYKDGVWYVDYVRIRIKARRI